MQKLDLFIICPIGLRDGDSRYRTETIKEVLLDAAISRFEATENVRVVAEIDHLDSSARDIIQGIVRKIINYDLIVAFVYNENQNVFYELGIAHSAGREVVILYENEDERSTLPFDLRGRSFIRYGSGSLQRWGLGRKCAEFEAVVSKIHDALVAAYKTRGQRRLAFNSEQLDALGARHTKYILHERFTDSLPYHDVKSMEFYDAATSYLALMGVSLHQLTAPGENWKLSDGKSVSFMKFLEILVLNKPIDIEIFMMHPNNPALPGMLKTFVNGVDEAEPQLAAVQAEIEAATAQWLYLMRRVHQRGSAGRIRILRLRRGIPYNRLSLTDKALIATPYFYRNTTNGTGPALQVTHDTSLYQLVRNDLDFLRNASATEIFEIPEEGDARPAE